MAIRGELDLEIGKFKAKLAEANRMVATSAGQMKRESGGIGTALATSAGGLNQVLGTLGMGVSAGGILAGIKGALVYADDLADLAVALNENAETLQRVDFAAQQTASVGVDQLAKSLIRLEKNLGDVENKDAAQALKRYGLTAGELMAMPIDQKILALSEAFQKARQDGTGVKDLMDLMGRSGAELIPMLTQSREALEDLFGRAPVVSDADVQRLAAANDELDAMIAKAKIFGVESVGQMQLGFQAIADLVSGRDPVAEMMAREQAANLARADRDAERQAGAASMDEATRLAAQTAAADAQKDLDEKAAKARARLEDARIRALPEGERIGALQGKLDALMSGALAGTGLSGKAGLQTMIAGLDTDYGRERQIGFVEALTEAEALEREIVGLKEKQAEMAKKEMEDRLKTSLGTKGLAAGDISARRGPTGAVQAAVDAIFGRAPGDPLLDENRTQTGVLREVVRELKQMRQREGGDDVFAFP